MKNNKKIKSYMIFTIFTVMMLLISGCSNNAGLNENNNNDDVNSNNNDVNNKITSDNSENVVVYFFWGDGCPHCATEKPFLEELENKYPEVEIKMFETWKNSGNAKLFQDVAKAYGTDARGVPTTFIGDEFWVGYADYMGQEMEQKILYCLENSCVNPGDKLVSN